MAGRQRIDRVRRQYNQWVANQTLEDYALRFTAKSARRWSAARVANTALGAISFLALEAIGGTITLNYGFTNATAAILVVSVIIFCCGLPIAYYAAKYGIDIDLLTRGAGFGYIGSTITSLIYASFTFIFFAIEAVILASALEMCFGIPLPDRLPHQRGRHHPAGDLRHHPDQPLSALDAAAVDRAARPAVRRHRLRQSAFLCGVDAISPASTATPTAISICCCSAPPPRSCSRWWRRSASRSTSCASCRATGAPREARWWIALLSAGPGWIMLGALKLLAGSFLAFFALSHGVSAEHAAEPAHMYLAAFRYVLSQPDRCAGADRHLRDPVAAQDQRDQRLCRFDRVVEFLFPPDPQPSRPRRLAGVQRAGRAAADGDRRLQGAGADARALFQRRHRLGRRAGRRSRHQQAARPEPAAHRVQARASLRHQPGRRRRDGDRHHRLDQRVLRLVRTDGEGPVAVRRADRRRSSPRR